MKKFIIILIFILFNSQLKADLINQIKTRPYDVVKIQLDALKNNDEKDMGINKLGFLHTLIIKVYRSLFEV